MNTTYDCALRLLQAAVPNGPRAILTDRDSCWLWRPFLGLRQSSMARLAYFWPKAWTSKINWTERQKSLILVMTINRIVAFQSNQNRFPFGKMFICCDLLGKVDFYIINMLYSRKISFLRFSDLQVRPGQTVLAAKLLYQEFYLWHLWNIFFSSSTAECRRRHKSTNHYGTSEVSDFEVAS